MFWTYLIHKNASVESYISLSGPVSAGIMIHSVAHVDELLHLMASIRTHLFEPVLTITICKLPPKQARFPSQQ